MMFESIPDTEGCINKVRCVQCHERVVNLETDKAIHRAQHKRGMIFYQRSAPKIRLDSEPRRATVKRYDE